MRKFASVVALTLLSLSPAAAIEGGVPVVDFSQQFISAAKLAGSEMPTSVGSCQAEGAVSCVFEYGSVRVLVEGPENLNGLANTVTIKSTLTTPLAQLLEAMEYATGVIRPEISPYAARRFAYGAFQSLIITQGAAFTDFIDGYQVETSEHDGAVVVVIAAPVF